MKEEKSDFCHISQRVSRQMGFNLWMRFGPHAKLLYQHPHSLNGK